MAIEQSASELPVTHSQRHWQLGADALRVWLPALLGLIAFVCLPAVWRRRPLWTVDTQSLLFMALFAGAYIAAFVALYRSERRGHRNTLARVFMVCAAAFLPVLIAVPAFHPKFSRVAMISAPLIALVLAGFTFSVRVPNLIRLLVCGVLAALGLGLQGALASGLLFRPQPQLLTSFLESALYRLRVTAYGNFIPPAQTQQGGIARFGDHYVLVTGDGDLYVFDRSSDGSTLEVQHLARRVPINASEFEAGVAGLPVAVQWFRVSDVLTQPLGDSIRVLISHHYWNVDQKCFVMRVSEFHGSPAEFAATTTPWRTVFDTSPCLPVVVPNSAPRFGGLENGGRLALLNDHEVLLSVGDHALDGWGSHMQAAQDPNISYGKVVVIDLDSLASRTLSRGHRNPQGLTVATSGTIWETEHGPSGGDELNLLHEGGNYGWPLATFGVDYGAHAWPLAGTPEQTAQFFAPYFSWTPGVGISNLLEVNDSAFERWRGDLIVGSLIARSLWRLRVQDGRVVSSERMQIGDRVRDLVPAKDGGLVLWTDSERIVFIEPVDLETSSAASLYRVCAACHAVNPDEGFGIGPPLEGVIDRRVASIDGYKYSRALQAAGGVWSRERLDAFLANPSAHVPGTTMQFNGIADPQVRRTLIDYMADPESELNVTMGAEDL